jgi:hypothetical protein
MKKTIKPRGNSKKNTKGKFDLPPVSVIYMNPGIGKAALGEDAYSKTCPELKTRSSYIHV